MGAMLEANGVQKADECYVKIYFVGSKGEALEIRKAWQGRRRQGPRGFRIGGSEWWVSGCWDGDM